MRIGISLPLTYLAGRPGRGLSDCLARHLGAPEAALTALRARGVESIEVQGVGPGRFDAEVLKALERVAGAGLGISLHSHLPAPDGSDIAASDGGPALEFLKACPAGTMMVVHAHADAHVCPEAVIASTSRSLREMMELHTRLGVAIHMALEINRYHGTPGPGVTYEGLLAVARQVGGGDWGFCWDMGHTQSSLLQGRLPSEPPPAFLERVIHVHVHDVSPEGDTHWPLAEGGDYLERNIRRLETRGYGGLYNLELYPTRWEERHVVPAALFDSVARLRRIGDRIGNGGVSG